MKTTVAALCMLCLGTVLVLWCSPVPEPNPFVDPRESAMKAGSSPPAGPIAQAQRPGNGERTPVKAERKVVIAVRSDPTAIGAGLLGLSTTDFRFRQSAVFSHNSTVEVQWAEPGNVIVWSDRSVATVATAVNGVTGVELRLEGVTRVIVEDEKGVPCPEATIWCATPEPFRLVAPVGRTGGDGCVNVYGVEMGCSLRASSGRMTSDWQLVAKRPEAVQRLTVDQPSIPIRVEAEKGDLLSGAIILVRDPTGRTTEFGGTDEQGVGLVIRKKAVAEEADVVVDRDGFAPGRVVTSGGGVEGRAVLSPGAHMRCVLTSNSDPVNGGRLVIPGIRERAGGVVDGVGLVRDVQAGTAKVLLRLGGATWMREVDLRSGWNELKWEIGGGAIQGIVRTAENLPRTWVIEARRTDESGAKRKGAVQVQTNTEGAYEFRGLERDVTFEIRLMHPETGFLVARQLARPGSKADFVVTTEDLPTCSVYGRVRTARGESINGSCTVVTRDGERHTSFLDADGNYKVDGLLPGNCTLLIEPSAWSSEFKRDLTLMPLEHQVQDVALPEPGFVEVSIDGVPAKKADSVSCAIEIGGVWRSMKRGPSGWRSREVAPGIYRVKGFGMAPLVETVRVESSSIANAKLVWVPEVAIVMTAVGLNLPDKTGVYFIRGEAPDSAFEMERSGDPTTWRIAVAPGRIYNVQIGSKDSGYQSGVLVVPSAGFVEGEAWYQTVVFQ